MGSSSENEPLIVHVENKASVQQNTQGPSN